MPFLNAPTRRNGKVYPGRTWMVRVHPTERGARTRIMSTRQQDRGTALKIEAFLADLHQRGDPLGVIRGILDGTLDLFDAYDARGRDALQAYAERQRAKATEVDLEPYVAAWHRERSQKRRGARTADKCLAQVRTLIPDGEPFPRSRFTLATVATWLRGLTCSLPVRNRYKASMSSFAKYLMEGGIVTSNPTGDIAGQSENPPRNQHYSRGDAQHLIAALPQPYQAIEALMCGAGLEWQSIERLLVGDVDLTPIGDHIEASVTCRAEKTDARSRVTRIVTENAWTIPYIVPALAGKPPDALAFPGVKHKRALDTHHATVAALGLQPSRLHDWRHTHARQLKRDGYPLEVLKKQLGHESMLMVLKVYGNLDATAEDYVPRLPRKATRRKRRPRTCTGLGPPPVRPG